MLQPEVVQGLKNDAQLRLVAQQTQNSLVLVSDERISMILGDIGQEFRYIQVVCILERARKEGEPRRSVGMTGPCTDTNYLELGIVDIRVDHRQIEYSRFRFPSHPQRAFRYNRLVDPELITLRLDSDSDCTTLRWVRRSGRLRSRRGGFDFSWPPSDGSNSLSLSVQCRHPCHTHNQ
jgi:hypothetical protein